MKIFTFVNRKQLTVDSKKSFYARISIKLCPFLLDIFLQTVNFLLSDVLLWQFNVLLSRRGTVRTLENIKT